MSEEEELLSASEAARRLGTHPRIAARRAQQAWDAHDLVLKRVGPTYVAPLSWWRKLLLEKRHPGRPRKDKNGLDMD